MSKPLQTDQKDPFIETAREPGATTFEAELSVIVRRKPTLHEPTTSGDRIDDIEAALNA